MYKRSKVKLMSDRWTVLSCL